MEILRSPFEALNAFLLAGGPVLGFIMIVTFVMWALIVERIIFFSASRGGLVKRVERIWNARNDHDSWYAKAIRRKLISQVDLESSSNLGVIKGLIAVLPLLGLLGTVTGMIEVFDVMAVTGSSNARLMAGGISKATIPTMAGLVASLSGIFFINILERQQKSAVSDASDRLVLEVFK